MYGTSTSEFFLLLMRKTLPYHKRSI